MELEPRNGRDSCHSLVGSPTNRRANEIIWLQSAAKFIGWNSIRLANGDLHNDPIGGRFFLFHYVNAKM